MQFYLSGNSVDGLVAKHASKTTNQSVCFLYPWKRHEEYSCTCFLPVSPFLTTHTQQILASCQQLHDGFTIGKHGWTEAFVQPLWLTSPLLSFVFPWMFLTVVFTALHQLLKLLLEQGFLFILCFLCFPLCLETQFLHGFNAALDDMKAVDDYGRVWEGLRDNGIHAVREVHGNFFDLLSLFPRYLHKNFDDI